MNLTIREIAEVCGGELKAVESGCVVDASQAKYDELVSRKVSGVVLDSRRVTPGAVFVATVGERVDGHRFIGDVFAKGAAFVITEKSPETVERECGVRTDSWGSYCLVENSLQALRELAEYYRGKLTIPVVGITGSVGKTSTKEFIAGVLAQKYRVLKTEGNFNNEIGVPLTLLRITEETEAAVVEMGISDFGEMHRLSKMARPDICVITNIGQCHLENLKTRDGILQAKSEIFDFMQPDGQVCLFGGDDKLITVEKVERNGRSFVPHFFGLGETDREEVYADEIVSRGLWGSDTVLHLADGSKFSVKVPLPGKHMVVNAAAAACVGGLLGLQPQQIREGIEKVTSVSGRSNLIQTDWGTLIDDCYNANPVSMKAALDLLALADTERTAILGDMFELGDNSDAMHASVGEYAVDCETDRILCVGENSVHMYNAAVARRAAAGASKEHIGIWYFENIEMLMTALAEQKEALIPNGSTVLIKASHGMHFEKILSSIAPCF